MGRAPVSMELLETLPKIIWIPSVKSLSCPPAHARSGHVSPRGAALARCIMGRQLKEAAAPEFEEFEVSAESGSHQRLRLFICGSPIR